MKVIRYFFLLKFLVLFTISNAQQNSRIVIVADVSENQQLASRLQGNLKLMFKDLENTLPNPSWDSIGSTKSGTRYTWSFEASTPKLVYYRPLFSLVRLYLIYPGDSIFMKFDGQRFLFSGRGSERFQLIQELKANYSELGKLVPGYNKRRPMFFTKDEFDKVNNNITKDIETCLPIIESYRRKLSPFDFDYIKTNFILSREHERSNAFSNLLAWKNMEKTFDGFEVAKIWDETMYKPWAIWARNQGHIPVRAGVLDQFIGIEVWRNFFWEYNGNDTLASKPMRTRLQFDLIVKRFKNLMREQALSFLIDEEVTQEMGALNPVAQSILKDYYAIAKYPGYKKWVNFLETSRQYSSSASNLGTIPFFQVADENDNKFTEKKIKGKFTIMNFWYEGCVPCKTNVPVLQKLQDKYKNDTNIVFLSVSVDERATWEKNKNKGIYTLKNGIHVYTGGEGKAHRMLRDFDITKYPMLRFVGYDGVMIIDKKITDFTGISEKWVEDMIKAKKFYPEDGPYVFNENGETKAIYFNGESMSTTSSFSSLKSATDINQKNFTFPIQKNVSVPPVTYAAPERMFVLSDVEGNFRAFRELLQSNNVIDNNFSWSFGKGHLVFAGDMFDRGEQVTECLWLIYSLEEKAKASGGMVHFILGNHEIMNLSGYDKYVSKKYKSNYRQLGKTLKEVYGEDSELGRWLRSKNIVEKIGDNLFCHGGISAHVNAMDITLEGINSIARPFYDKESEAMKSSDHELKILYNDRLSPFWYRQYYDSKPLQVGINEFIYGSTEAQVDSTCQKFGVHRIITGHTIVADTISVHYGGKVMNTDVQHASGKSEALLIEGDKFYRVNGEGKRVLLFIDDKKKAVAKAKSTTHSKTK